MSTSLPFPTAPQRAPRVKKIALPVAGGYVVYVLPAKVTVRHARDLATHAVEVISVCGELPCRMRVWTEGDRHAQLGAPARMALLEQQAWRAAGELARKALCAWIRRRRYVLAPAEDGTVAMLSLGPLVPGSGDELYLQAWAKRHNCTLTWSEKK